MEQSSSSKVRHLALRPAGALNGGSQLSWQVCCAGAPRLVATRWHRTCGPVALQEGVAGGNLWRQAAVGDSCRRRGLAPAGAAATLGAAGAGGLLTHGWRGALQQLLHVLQSRLVLLAHLLLLLLCLG